MVSIIIVSYNTKEVLGNCLRSILDKVKYSNFRIIVVDNNSSDGTQSIIKKEFPQVNFIENKKNIGFAAANNLGIKRVNADYYFLLNPDTILLEDSVSKLVEFLEKNKEVGIAGPRLLNKDRTLQSSMRNFSSLLSHFLEVSGLVKIYKKIPILREFTYLTSSHNKITFPDWISGAALMIKKEVILKIGYLDESYFMFSEEVDFQFRAQKVGFKVAFLPETSLIHLGGESTKKVNKMQVEIVKNSYKFAEKNLSKTKLFFAKLMTKFFLGLKLLYSCIKYFFTKDPILKENILVIREIIKL